MSPSAFVNWDRVLCCRSAVDSLGSPYLEVTFVGGHVEAFTSDYRFETCGPAVAALVAAAPKPLSVSLAAQPRQARSAEAVDAIVASVKGGYQ